MLQYFYPAGAERHEGVLYETRKNGAHTAFLCDSRNLVITGCKPRRLCLHTLRIKRLVGVHSLLVKYMQGAFLLINPANTPGALQD